MDTIINVERLSKSFGDVKIIKDISFSVFKGEFVSIMGRSGSGKSTLLYNISGMDRPTSGKVDFLGHDLATINDKQLSDIRLNHMGFVFQHAYLLKKLSVKDNICLPGYKAEALSKKDVEKLADKLMQMTDIGHIAQNDIKKVSGGQLQRASICRALINSPEILFADEPTGALNSGATEEIMQIINQVNKAGTTVVMVTHDTKVASVAERIIFIKDGSLHDELNLGKFDGDKTAHINREKLLVNWLENTGF